MNASKFVLPSRQLQSAIAVFEEEIRRKTPADQPMPEWYVMAFSMYSAFEVFVKAQKLDSMFDTGNSFDRAMLVWCTEAERRENAKKPQPPTIDLSRN